MAYNEARKRAVDNYKRSKLHRIPVDVKKEHFEVIQSAAEKAGQPVTRYVKQAIDEKLQKDGFLPDPEEEQQN